MAPALRPLLRDLLRPRREIRLRQARLHRRLRLRPVHGGLEQRLLPVQLDGHGHYTELAQKNIDTGMGLERLACVCQGVDSLFDVDTVMNITHKVSELTGAHYGESHRNDVSLRVITDHIRSATFLIGDGVLPLNEGRGYVLRRLLRRAATASSSA